MKRWAVIAVQVAAAVLVGLAIRELWVAVEHHDGVGEPRTGPLGLLRDLQDLYLLATLVDVTWVMVKQAAQALRDDELLQVVEDCDHETAVQLAWLVTRMKQSAPQVLVAAR